jgi:hypothetical protein
MAHKKLTSLFAVIAIGAALIAAPTLAAGRGGHGGGGGGGGGRGGGGGGGMHAGGGGFQGGGGFSRGFSGRVGGGSIGVARVSAFHTGGFGVARGHFVAQRAFFPHHRRFARPFFGYGAYAGYSCWRWVPTAFGLRRVWVCDYPYESYY